MIILEGEKITNKEMLWKEVHTKMELPDYFGNNLDGLADVLSEQNEKMQVRILNAYMIEEKLEMYGKKFLAVLEQFCVVEKE